MDLLIDEMDRLRQAPVLHDLLRHYGDRAVPDRQIWHDRLAVIDDVSPRDMARWHGELLAHGWIEQNTGVAAACYRITPSGLRALKQAQAPALEPV